MRFSLKIITRFVPSVLLAAGFTVASLVPAQAFFWLDPNVREHIDHFVYCKHLAFENPAQHSKECGPPREHPPYPKHKHDSDRPVVKSAPPVVIPSPPSDDCRDASLNLKIFQPTYLVAALPSGMSSFSKSDAYDPAPWQEHGNQLVAVSSGCAE